MVPVTVGGAVVSSSTSFEAVVYKPDSGDGKQGKLQLTATVYYKDTPITTATKTFTIPKESMRLTAEITDWPFASDSNLLALEMTVSGQRALLLDSVLPVPLSNPKVTEDGETMLKTLTFESGMFLDASLGVTMDGVAKSMPIDVPTDSSKILRKFAKFATKTVCDLALRYEEPVTVVSFESDKDPDGNALIPTVAKFKKGMVTIQFCPNGDCEDGPFVTLTPYIFEERQPASASGGDDVVRRALDLNEDDDGALKFTAEITNWPFAADDNYLALYTLTSGKREPLIKDVTPTYLSNPTLTDKEGDPNTKIVVFDSGMFMDMPLGVTMDGANKQVTVDVPTGTSDIVWKFSTFATKAVYDPVLRYEKPTTVVSFKKGPDGKASISTEASFMKGMATIQFCPTGACANGPYITLMPSRFEEMQPVAGGVAAKSVFDTFNLNEDDSVQWKDAVDLMVNNELVASTTSFEAAVYMFHDDESTIAKLKLTATVYYKETTVTNAGQSLTRTRRSPGEELDPPTIATKPGDTNTKIVAIGGGIYMDVPLGVLDGSNKALKADVVSDTSSIKWMFTKFATKATYDPVLRYVAPTPAPLLPPPPPAPVPVPGPTKGATPAPTPAAPVKSSTSPLMLAISLSH
ncbi:hypothetical protein Poli38472_005768 [Pythium oligandrum]|uniref:Uncharacterized protein n=1 Tax=Pythium oligandrum TaxID=41045 RepID=A0A8K1CTB0_PYTOL|nr:hypothetical protein Poli38472_005768 [Pythium oligandrum]|eukprot:TMW68300.1 hypothetical protein Poli38472_005768 [Pythium oligandrum]